MCVNTAEELFYTTRSTSRSIPTLLCVVILQRSSPIRQGAPVGLYLPIFPSFRPMGMMGEACLPSNAYYPRTPDYTLCSGVHACWSEHSDSSFVYRFMSLDYGFGTMTTTTILQEASVGVYLPSRGALL